MENRAPTLTIEQPGWNAHRAVQRHELVVVIVTFNSARHIEDCLRPLRDQKVLVVDNASSDSTCELICRYFPTVRLIRMSENLGLSQAFNIAWRQVPGCDVLFINPDVVVDPHGIDELCEAMRDLPRAAVVAPKLLNADGLVQHTACTFPTLASALARRTILGRTRWGMRNLRSHLGPALNSAPKAAPVDWALGAAMLIRGEPLERLQGFDERYFRYCEDVDFCARAWQRGLQAIYFPGVFFRHEYQRASRRSWDLTSRATRAHLRSTIRLMQSYPAQYFGRPLRPAALNRRCE